MQSLPKQDALVLSSSGAGRDDLLAAALTAGGSPNARDFCGDPPLLLAARGGGCASRLACCRRLLAAGADAAAQGSRGETAVMVAIQTGSEQLLEALLATGVDVGARSDSGLTAVQLACLHGRPAMLAQLMQHLHAQLGSCSAQQEGGSGAAASALAPAEDAARQQQMRAAEQAMGRQLVLAAYAAVAAGEPRCLQLLVSDELARAAYASQFHCHPGGGAPCLAGGGGGGSSSRASGAAGGGASGTPVRGAWRRDRAAEERLQGELGFLLDPEVLGPRSSRPACFLWQTSGMPSHLAAALNQPECLHALLSGGFCHVDERTSDGFTPLMLAAAGDAVPAAAVLLRHGAALEARNAATRTPAFLAAVSGSAGVLGLLARAGADLSAAEETRGCSPLAAAIGRAASLCSASTGNQLQAAADATAAPFLRCTRLLLEGGASPLQAAKDGSTAMHAAAEGGFLPGLQLLLSWQAGSDSNGGHETAKGACGSGSSGDMGIGPLLETVDGAGRTPLARAAAAGRAHHRECVLLLLSLGAAVGSPDLASQVLDCLLGGGSSGAGSGRVVTVWQLLARLNAAQLDALTACPKFFDLPHTEAPEQPLPPAALDAMLQLAAEGCSNLLYNVSPAQSASHGRRPAYLLELLRRHAAEAGGCAAGAALGSRLAAELCSQLAAAEPGPGLGAAGPLVASPCVAACGGSRDGTSASSDVAATLVELRQGIAAQLRMAVCGSPHVAKLLRMWASVQMLLQHACCLARCAGVPQADCERLSVRVGHLLSAYHTLGGLCSTLGLSLSAGVAQPYEPLAESSAAAAGPLRVLLTPAPSLEPPAGASLAAATAAASAGPAASSGGSPGLGAARGVVRPSPEEAAAKLLGAGASCSPSPAPGDRASGPPAPPQLPEAAAAAPAAAQRHPQAEPALAAALHPFREAVGELVAAVADPAQLRAWHFLLEYRQAASLGCRQRLLQSLVGAWPRRPESQLALSTGRQGVVQRVCGAVEEQAAGAGASMAGVLWHGLKVAFEQENGVGDGVRREWFRLLAGELTHPDTGLFESHNGGASFAPALHASVQREPTEPEGAHLRKFELVGCLMGVALLQGCTLPGLALTAATWRALVAQPPQPEADLQEADPTLHRSLQLLRALGPAELDSLGLHFEVHDCLGRCTELCPGGSGLQVDAGNLGRYIALLGRYKMVDGPSGAAGALARGMRGVLTAGALDTLGRCVDHAELNALLAGLAELELPAWQAAARYEGCCPATPQVRWLWTALAAAAAPTRAQVLSFVTGSASLPAGGFAALRGFNGALHPFTVCLVLAEGDDRLPRASTCFNTLFLPAYSSAEVLQAWLLQAVAAAQLFDEAVVRR